MAFQAINYLIGVEKDRIINGAGKSKGHNKRQSPWGAGCEEKAVCSEDQQVGLMEADSRSKTGGGNEGYTMQTIVFNISARHHK